MHDKKMPGPLQMIGDTHEAIAHMRSELNIDISQPVDYQAMQKLQQDDWVFADVAVSLFSSELRACGRDVR